MTASHRPSRILTRSLTALIPMLLLLPILALATPLVGGKPTELLSGKTLMGKVKGAPPLQDLAISGCALVRISPGASQQDFRDMLARTGCGVLKTHRTPGLYLVSLPAGMSVNTGVGRLRAQGIVAYAGPNRVGRLFSTPNDPYYDYQYHWPLIGADKAWDQNTGSTNVTVAVIDSGLDMDHEDLAGKVWTNSLEVAGNGADDDNNGYIDDVHGWDFMDADSNPDPTGDITDTSDVGSVCHGTHCAGLVGAETNNGIGVAGHDWNCKIMPLKIGDSFGNLTWDGGIEAIEYATANGANVITMSFGGLYDDAYTLPITEAFNAGIVVCAAAGNYGLDLCYLPFSPVCNDGPNNGDNHVIGVGATDELDQVCYFSNYDSQGLNYIDVMAPGWQVYSTLLYTTDTDFRDEYGAMDGTSMSCPIVAGLAALVKASFPTDSAQSIVTRIRNGCVNIDSLNPTYVGMIGAGRINSANCVGDAPPGAVRNLLATDTLGDDGGSVTVSWNLSLDDGRGSDDVTRYEVFRGTAIGGSFTSLGTLTAGTKSFVDTSVDNYTDYYYEVTTYDATNSTASRVSDAVQARDDLAPEAVTLTATDTPNDTGGSISLSWTGYTVPADFGGYRVYRSEKSFTSVSEMEPLTTVGSSGTKTYQDRNVVDDTDYYYAVTCIDTSVPANELTMVTCVGPVRANPNYAFGYPVGLSMVGIGLTVPDDAPGAVFDLSNGARLARWDPSTSVYHVFDSSSSADTFMSQAPGRGYWLRTALPMVLNLSGSAVTSARRIDFVAGWNQLGNPYLGDVDVTETQVRVGGTTYTLDQSNENGYTRNYMWGYNSATSSYKLISPALPFSTPALGRGQGFFFLAERAGQIILPYPEETETAQVAAKPATVPVDWSLRLVASTEGVADTDNFLGVSSKPAKISGIKSPPPVCDGFDLYFPKDGAHTATAFVKSLGAGQQWTAEVSCSRPKAVVRLTWPDLSGLPADCRPILKDVASGTAVYMRTANGYNFTFGSGETTRQFTIDISPKAGDLLAIRSLQTGSGASGAQVSYSLSAPATVEVSVLNLAGRVVRVLQSGAVNSGTQSVLWNGLSDSGSAAPAGSYLVRLTARSDNGQAVSAVGTLSLRK